MPAKLMAMFRDFLTKIFGVIVLVGAASLCAPVALSQSILIDELRDIDFGRAEPMGGTLRADMRFCVVMDQNALYRVLAYGEEVGGDFTLQSGPYRLPYRVRYTDRRNQRGFRALLPGQPMTGLKVRGNNNGICRRSNAIVRIVLPSEELRQAAAGSYRGTLTLMVSPE